MTQVAGLAVVTVREDYAAKSEDVRGILVAQRAEGLYAMCTHSVIKNTDYSAHL